MSSKRVPLLVVLVGALVLAGCGGEDEAGPPSATEWAGEVCSAMTTWIESVSSTTESLGDGDLPEDGLTDAADEVRDATQTLVEELAEAGRPDTATAQEAETAIEELAGGIEASVEELERAAADVTGAGDGLGALSLVTGTLSTIADQVAATFDELGRLDPAGELETAFDEADACSELRGE